MTPRQPRELCSNAPVNEVLKFLELCASELGGADAKLEIGGTDPDDARLICSMTEAGFRLVVRFAEAPRDRELKKERLDALAATFNELGRVISEALPREAISSARRELGDLLRDLALRVGAERAVVVDGASPVFFGDSHGAGQHFEAADAAFIARSIDHSGLSLDALAQVLDGDELPDGLDAKGLDPGAIGQLAELTTPPLGVARAAELRLALAVADVRAAPAEARQVRDGVAPHISRPFAQLYRAVLIFAKPFSEMHADGHLVRALPVIQQKTLALPPEDPKGGAKIQRLRPT